MVDHGSQPASNDGGAACHRSIDRQNGPLSRAVIGRSVMAIGVMIALGASSVGVGLGRPDLDTAHFDNAERAPFTTAERIELRALADAATVGISGLGCDGPLRGSGFVVDGVTFTNRHLVIGGRQLKIDRLVDATLVPIDRLGSVLDVAVAPGVDVVELEFAAGDPAPGTAVVVAGHAGGGANVVTEGTVQLYADGDLWGVGGPVMLIDVATEPGHSGGPVLDREGRVVGMLQGFETTIGLTLALPVEALQSWYASEVPVQETIVGHGCPAGASTS